MKNLINWFEIYTADFDRAKKFYSEVFQFTFKEWPNFTDGHPDMRYAAFEHKDKLGVGGALVKMKQVQPGTYGTIIYFESDDVNTELSKVEAAGGKILRSKIKVGDFGFIALVGDTEGNVFGLHSIR